MKHLKKLDESQLNEATYVKGKFDNQMRDLDKGDIPMKDMMDVIKMNITESPDYEDTKAASDKAVVDIDKAYEDFKAALAAAIKPVEQNYTGV